MAKTRIEWTEYSWSPVVGCSKVSEGCEHCYAERMAHRLAHIGRKTGNMHVFNKYDPVIDKSGHWNGKINADRDTLGDPLKWKKSRRIFVCSMGDLFHKEVPMITILKTFDIMQQAKQHQFIVLTKRPHRMLEFCQKYGLMSGPHGFTGSGETWPDNVIAMTTAENQQRVDERIPLLMRVPAKIKGVSIEPMLGPIDLYNIMFRINKKFQAPALLNGIELVIVGGETGPGARPMHPNWVRKIRDDCQAAGVSFFFKSWGDWIAVYDRDNDDPEWSHCPKARDHHERYLNLAGGYGFHGERVLFVRKVGKKKAGRLLDGREWSEWPERDNHENQ